MKAHPLYVWLDEQIVTHLAGIAHRLLSLISVTKYAFDASCIALMTSPDI